MADTKISGPYATPLDQLADRDETREPSIPGDQCKIELLHPTLCLYLHIYRDVYPTSSPMAGMAQLGYGHCSPFNHGDESNSIQIPYRIRYTYLRFAGVLLSVWFARKTQYEGNTYMVTSPSALDSSGITVASGLGRHAHERVWRGMGSSTARR